MVTAITIIMVMSMIMSMVMSMIMLADARAGRRSNQPVWAAAQLPRAYTRGRPAAPPCTRASRIAAALRSGHAVTVGAWR
jgi:hypothetical protein